uniref:Uncharacterized protein n=1 Tax=Bubo bubo TaxID=30461 RepID=A0A8C0IJ51_BUBBB
MARGTASVGIQTISDCSVQTEPDQLLRVSPSIHITTHDPRVEIVKYISAPEKTQRGESLACQTEPEPAPQPGQTLGKFEKKKPDPLEIGYQSHLPAESLSQLVTRQPPRSPQVLYSPVSPLSPHRLLESSFATSERLNKAHVPPQKHFTADSAQRQQTLPRPIKTMQRSLSDPKPISPTAEEAGKDRFSLYQHPLLPGTQVRQLGEQPFPRGTAPGGTSGHFSFISAVTINILKGWLPAAADGSRRAQTRAPKSAELLLGGRIRAVPCPLPQPGPPPLPRSSYCAWLWQPLLPPLPPHTEVALGCQLGTPSQPGFRPQNPYQAPSAFAGVATVPAAQPALFQSPADIAGGHQKPRQTSLADLEQKIPTNYEVIGVATSSSAVPDVTFSTAPVSGGYEQYKAPEARPAERVSVAQGPSASFSSESLYTSLEQNIPRNYVMIEDISELTKESPAVEGPKAELAGTGADSRHGREKSDLGDAEGSSRPCCYTKAEEESEEDVYDHHGPDHRGKNSYHRGMESNGRVSGSSTASSYYYGDSEYRHSSRVDKHSSGMALPKHSSKNLAPAVVSSKRSKHRKQGMEQKISKFSPIEEAKDVESDLASYAATTSVGSSNVASRAKKLQEEITYGLKKNVYEQQKYYGVSSRDLVDEEERVYSGSSRTRSSGYGMEKPSSREAGSRSKSYEREGVERSQKGGSKPSHSLPDVQKHIKDVPRSHSYKHEEGYGMDDAHCVVSDSEGNGSPW